MSLREAHVELIDCDHRTPPPAATGYPYVTIPDLRDGRIEVSNARRITAEHYRQWTRRAKPQAYDVILSRRTNPGVTAFVPSDLEFALGQNLVLLRTDGSVVDPQFLRWLVRGPDWWAQIQRHLNAGAVFDSLKCADIPNFRLPIPPLSEQRRIAELLTALDDKIDLNCRMSQTLESMARALFKSWFVDFDPVRAKTSGHCEDLASAIADVFPASFQTSDIGEIPTGWRVADLGEIIELKYGKALSDADRRLGPIPVFGSNGQIGWHDEPLAKGPGVVVGRKGNPGAVTWCPTDFFAIDTTFYVAPKVPGLSLRFLYHALRDQDLARLGADSAVPGLSRNVAYMNRQLYPPPRVLAAFDSVCAPLGDRSTAAEQEADTLAVARDALLANLLGALRPKPFRSSARIGG